VNRDTFGIGTYAARFRIKCGAHTRTIRAALPMDAPSKLAEFGAHLQAAFGAGDEEGPEGPFAMRIRCASANNSADYSTVARAKRVFFRRRDADTRKLLFCAYKRDAFLRRVITRAHVLLGKEQCHALRVTVTLPPAGGGAAAQQQRKRKQAKP
jgi:hypothetical protein